MGTVLFLATKDSNAQLNLKALGGGLLAMLIVLVLLSIFANHKHASKVLYFVLFSIILLCSSVIFATSLAHMNSQLGVAGIGLLWA